MASNLTISPTLAGDLVATNTTDYPSFILLGLPGHEYAHIWVSIPVCIVYLIAVIGNSIIFFIIKTEESLHSPMYIFFCMLAAADIIIINAVVPKALAIFWLNSKEIYLNSCIAQMFIAHSFTFVESGVLALMAVDRYIAICKPLRYASILTNQRIAILGLAYLLKSSLYCAPSVYFIKRLHFCKTNFIAHTYCEYLAVAKGACSDFTPSIVSGLSAVMLTVIQDLSFIVFSYFMILRAVARLTTHSARWKALKTCIAHVCVLTSFYVPIIATVLIQRYASHIAPYFRILLANFYYLVPPMVNPLVYGIRTRKIRVRVLSMIYCEKVSSTRLNLSLKMY